MAYFNNQFCFTPAGCSPIEIYVFSPRHRMKEETEEIVIQRLKEFELETAIEEQTEEKRRVEREIRKISMAIKKHQRIINLSAHRAIIVSRGN